MDNDKEQLKAKRDEMLSDEGREQMNEKGPVNSDLEVDEFMALKDKLFFQISEILDENKELYSLDYIHGVISTLVGAHNRLGKCYDAPSIGKYSNPEIVVEFMVALKNIQDLFNQLSSKADGIRNKTVRLFSEIKVTETNRGSNERFAAQVHDRLVNDSIFGIDYLKKDVDRFDVYYKKIIDSFDNTGDFSSSEFRDMIAQVINLPDNFAQSFYRLEQYLNQLKYLSDNSNLINSESSDIAYDETFKRHTDFDRKISKIKSNKESSDDQKLVEVNESKTLQVDWEREFNRFFSDLEWLSNIG